MKRINEITIGEKVKSPRNGDGVVSNKTVRTVTVTFFNGNIVKNTYRSSDAPFYSSDY